MKNKKGFTLIELLAVIIILSVIALIATPIVLNVVDNARNAANKNSVYGLIDGAKLYYMESVLDSEKQEKFDGITNILSDIKNNLSGKAPESGSLYINEEGNIGIAVVYDDKCYVKDFKESEVTESDKIESCTLTTQIASSYVIFGGKYLDYFEKVIETKDGGYLAIGSSNSKKILNIENKSNNINYDGIIVKVDKNGYIEWYNTYGYEGHDYFRNVLEIDDGYIVLAKVNDISGVGNYQKIYALKYDKNGKIVDTKLLFEKNDIEVTSILKIDNSYYVMGSGRNMIDSGSKIIYLAKYSLDFEEEYIKTYSDDYLNYTNDVIINTDENIVLSGYSAGTGGIVEGIQKSPLGTGNGLILEIKPETGEVISKAVLPIESHFYKVVETDDSYIVCGYDKENGNYDALLAKYSKTPDNNGILPLVYKKTLTGSKNDYFKSLTVKDNKIITVGYALSKDGNYMGLNDNDIETGIISEFDNDGNLLSIKKIGGSSGEDNLKLYTTNDPSKDLTSWCTSSTLLDPNSNYNYVDCLQPFNNSNIISYNMLISKVNNYELNLSNSLNWLSLFIRLGNAGNVEVKNFKLKFEGTDYVTINEAVNLKYIEPLVLYGSMRGDGMHFFPNSSNILNGSNLGTGNYPYLRILIKPKKKVTNIYFEASKDVLSYQGSFYLNEYKDFDISIEQAR